MQKECTEAFCLRVQQAIGHADPLCPLCGGTGKVAADASSTTVEEKRTNVQFLTQAED